MVLFGNPECKFCHHRHGIGMICEQNVQGRREMRIRWEEFLATFPPSIEVQQWETDGGHP